MNRRIEERIKTGVRVKVMPSLRRNESFSAIGTVIIAPFDFVDGEKFFREGEVTRHNLIVREGRGSLLDAITGTLNLKLKYIRWGKGGALAYPAGDPLVALVVNDLDTNVAAVLLDKPLSPFVRVSRTQVTYHETLISDEVNSDVNEAAIMFENAVTLDRLIFARITFPTVRLTSTAGTGVDLTWTFDFTRAEQA